MMSPTIGLKFQHRRVLDAANRPAIYVVTAIRKGVIYYKQPQEQKAKECCELDYWPRVFGGDLTGETK
jgi:hypothetical protein